MRGKIKKVAVNRSSFNNISIQEMLDYSLALWERHKDRWSPMEPEYTKLTLLWLVGEIGEVVDIIKKDGEIAIMQDKMVRSKTVEEITDCFMYLADVLNRLKITKEEFSRVYHSKMQYNLQREYKRKYSK